MAGPTEVKQSRSQSHYLLFEWTGLTLGSVSEEFLELPGYSDKTVHVFGLFAGATVVIEGTQKTSTEVVGAGETFNIRSPDMVPIVLSVTASGFTMLEDVMQVRPVVVGGDVTTNLTVRIGGKGI